MDISQIKSLQADSRWPMYLSLFGQAKALEMLSKMRGADADREALRRRYASSYAKESEMQHFKSAAFPPRYDPFFVDLKVPLSPPPAQQKSKSGLHPFWGDLSPVHRKEIGVGDMERMQNLSRLAAQADVDDTALLELIRTFGMDSIELMLTIITGG